MAAVLKIVPSFCEQLAGSDKLSFPSNDTRDQDIDSHIEESQQVKYDCRLECEPAKFDFLENQNQTGYSDGLNQQRRVQHRPQREVKPTGEHRNHQEERLNTDEEFHARHFIHDGRIGFLSELMNWVCSRVLDLTILFVPPVGHV